MAERIPLMIVDAGEAAGKLEVLNPYDQQVLTTVETAGAQHVDRALATAHSLFRDRGSWLALDERIRILERTALLMEARIEDLAVQAASEGGKPLVDSRIEAARAVDGVRLCIEHLRTDAGEVIPMRTMPSSLHRIALTQKEPVGVVAAVSAFNHPLNLIVHQVAAAVAAGCPVIVKPAEDTPISCFRLVEILREAGLPEGWCQAFITSEIPVAEKLVTDPRVGFFSFIGSARVGWMLRSKLAPGTRCALEHGGAAPVILAADADLDRAVQSILKGGFYHAGQVCVSVQRVYAPRAMARPFAERLAAAAAELTIGDPTSPETDVGPLIRTPEVQRVHRWVEEAVAAGAERLSGGAPIGETCYPCTVLLDPPADARVSVLEVFGPVVCVYGYDGIDQAIMAANALPVAFQSAVFTRDLDTALYVGRKLDASAVMINDHTAFRVDGMPFAGLRQSGLGVGGIPYTIEDMQISKMLVVYSESI